MPNFMQEFIREIRDERIEGLEVTTHKPDGECDDCGKNTLDIKIYGDDEVLYAICSSCNNETLY